MRTPAGQECRYYYEDFHRGRQVQECRLIRPGASSLAWSPVDCRHCPVPGILRANGSPDLRLDATVYRRFGFWRRIRVNAYCLRHAIEVQDPHRGCPACLADAPPT